MVKRATEKEENWDDSRYAVAPNMANTHMMPAQELQITVLTFSWAGAGVHMSKRLFPRNLSGEQVSGGHTQNDNQHVANGNHGRGQRGDEFSCTPEARENAHDAKCTEKAQCTDYSHVDLRKERECGDGNDYNVEHVKGVAPARV